MAGMGTALFRLHDHAAQMVNISGDARDGKRTYSCFEHGIVRLETVGPLLPSVAIASDMGVDVAAHTVSGFRDQELGDGVRVLRCKGHGCGKTCMQAV